MIEKIPFETETITHDGKIMEVQTHASPYDLQVKINELVDAVNELHEEAENNARIRADHEHKIENLQKQIDNVSCTILDLATPDGENKALKSIQAEPADPFAEQRKYIGCLCRFWNFKDGAVDIGILKAIDNLKPTIPYINDIDCSYAYCEPVKPDDDIIYKGGDND